MCRSRYVVLTCLLLLTLVAPACGGTGENETPPSAAVPDNDNQPAAPTEATASVDEANPAAEPAITAEPDIPALMNPSSPAMNATAPGTFRVLVDTTKGPFTLEVHREWAPRGADRFYNLVREGYYDGNRFFRVVDGFVVQFGVNGDPELNSIWRDADIPDDPAKQGNVRGRLTFAHAGPNTRSTQLFINLGDNINLDLDFPAFGEVIDGMGVVDSLYSGYGDGAPYGNGPDQNRIQSEGNRYLGRDFPQLDYIRSARIIAGR